MANTTEELIERLRKSADNSEQRGWLTHSRLDRAAAAEIERLQYKVKRLEGLLVKDIIADLRDDLHQLGRDIASGKLR